ncbi:uncharacterized protein (TIGR04141 family) [Saccharopolyspora phatthalungensis]|uniref:Uncharacterized protein (TIGR04141 family) n=1 Tax=Saccharopolyspora phatthalungensis TaxID=664693 RepID=A0A840QGN4_9PSEU|nr:uncharacterized protein (TIGR04141 family) [Saccharopolyspora phatthalungensis]
MRAADKLATIGVPRWLEANLSIGSRQFHLADGRWYEIGERFLPEITRTVTRVIRPTASVELPPWEPGQDEGDYNLRVPRECPDQGYVCLDKRNVPNPLKSPDSLEICDLLAEDGTLILVKRANRSDALSHLFSQAQVAVRMLMNNPDVRERFANKVAEVAGRRIISADFKPTRLVFAILLKHGMELTTNSLFAFSQVTLAETVKELESWGVQVEVVGIKVRSLAELESTAL